MAVSQVDHLIAALQEMVVGTVEVEDVAHLILALTAAQVVAVV